MKTKLYLVLVAISFCIIPAHSFSAPVQPNVSTYTNSQHGFSLQYPKGVSSIQTTNYESKYPFTELPVAFLAADIPSSDTKGYLTVNISTDSDVVATCEHAPGSYKVANIHSVQFLRSDSSYDGSNGFTRDYDTVRDRTCYRIELITFASACVSSGCAGSPDQHWSRQSMSKLLEKLDHIAQTFQFVPAGKE